MPTAVDLRIPPANRLEKLVGNRAGQYSIRIRDLGASPQFWLGLQTDHDLDKALDRLGDRLEREVHTVHVGHR